ncbi:MAG: hypothetical protein BWY76_03358 [bacterium ADurb.Bin429]|nr:MAG: hypothetical protein BWY76_03358 [bacterium ADurb.Bin429]
MSTLLKKHRGLLILLLTCLIVVVGITLRMTAHHLRYAGRQATLSATEQARLWSMPPRYPTTIGGWTTEGIFGAYQLEQRYGPHPLNARWHNPRTGDTWAFRYDMHHQPVAISPDGIYMLQLPTYPDHPSLAEALTEWMKRRNPDAPPYRRAEIRIIQRPHTVIAVLPVATRPDPFGWNIRWRGMDFEGNSVFLDTPRTVAIRQTGGDWLLFRW